MSCDVRFSDEMSGGVAEMTGVVYTRDIDHVSNRLSLLSSVVSKSHWLGGGEGEGGLEGKENRDKECLFVLLDIWEVATLIRERNPVLQKCIMWSIKKIIKLSKLC